MGSHVADAFNEIVTVLERGQKNGLFNLDEAGEIYNSLKILQPIVQNAHNAKNLNQSDHIKKVNEPIKKSNDVESLNQSDYIKKMNEPIKKSNDVENVETINFVNPIIKNI